MGNLQDLAAWKIAADGVLSMLLKDTRWYNLLRAEDVAQAHFPAGRWRKLFEAIGGVVVELRSADSQEIPAALLMSHYTAGRPDGKVSQEEYEWINSLWENGNSRHFELTFDKNIEVMREAAYNFYFDSTLQAAQKMRSEGKPVQVVRAWENERWDALNRNLSPTQLENITAIQSGCFMTTDFEEMDLPEMIRSASEELNRVTGGGFIPGVVQIAGAQKSQKTRFAHANACYAALKHGKSVAVYTLEEHRRLVYRRWQIMIAGLWLDQNYPQALDSHGLPLSALSIEMFLSRGGQALLADKRRLQALDIARQVILGLGERLRVYDDTTSGGGIRNLTTFANRYRMDCELYGVPDIAIYDHTHHAYVPNLDGVFNDYQKQMAVADVIHPLATESENVFFLLAQRSKDDNQRGLRNGNLAGTRGGEKIGEVGVLTVVMNGDVDSEGNVTRGKVHFNLVGQRFGQPDTRPKSEDIASTGWIQTKDLVRI